MRFIYEDNKNSSSLDFIKHMYAEPFFVHHAVYKSISLNMNWGGGEGEEKKTGWQVLKKKDKNQDLKVPGHKSRKEMSATYNR